MCNQHSVLSRRACHARNTCSLRPQFALDALCSDDTWEPPCGEGLDFAPQAVIVDAFRPQCQCQAFALSTTVPLLCNASNGARSVWIGPDHFFSGQQVGWQRVPVPTVEMRKEIGKEHRQGRFRDPFSGLFLH